MRGGFRLEGSESFDRSGTQKKGRQREPDELTRRQQMQRQRQREWQLAHALKDHNWMPMSILRSQPVSAHYLSHLRLIQEERRQDMEAMRNSKCGPVGYEWSHWADSFSQTARKQWLQGLIDSRRLRAMKQALWPQKKKDQGALTRRSVSELSSCSSSQISTAFPAKWGCVVFCSSCMRGEVPRSVELRQSTGHHYKVCAKEKSEHTNRTLVKNTNRTLVKNTNRMLVTSTDRTLAKTTQGGVVHTSRQRVKRKQVLDTRWQKRESKVKGGQVRKQRQQRKRRKQKLGTGRRLVRGKRVHSHPVSAPPAPAQERGVSSDVGNIGQDATKAAAAVDLKRRLSLDLKAIKSQAEARGATKLKVSSRKTESTKETSQSGSQRYGDSHGKSSKAKRPTKTAVIQLPRSSAAESNKPMKKADDSAKKDHRAAADGARERKETAKSMGKKGGRGGGVSPSISDPVKESNSSSKRGQQQGQQGSKKGRPRTTRTGRRKVRKPKPLTSSPPPPRRSKTHRSESVSSDKEDEDARSHSHFASGKPADNMRTRSESEKDKQRMRKGAKSGDGGSLSRGEKNRSSDDEQDGKGKDYASLLSTSSQTSDDIRERSGKGQKQLLQKRSKSADRGLLSGSAGKGRKGKQLFASTPGTPKRLKLDRHGAAADSENGKRSSKRRSKAHDMDDTVSLTVSEAGKTVSLTVTVGSPGAKHTGGGENAEPDSGMGARDGSPAPVEMDNDDRQGGDNLTGGEIAELHRGTGAKDASPGPIDIASADRQAGDGRTSGEIAAEWDKGTGAKDEVPVPIDIASANRQGGDVVANKNILSSALPIDVQQSTVSSGLSTPASLPNPLGSSSQTAAPFEDMQDYVQENIEIEGAQGTKYDAQGGGRGDVGSRQGAAAELRLSSSPTDANAMKRNRTPSQEEVLEVQDWKMARFFSSADAQSLSPSPAPKTPRKVPGGFGDASLESDNEGKEYGQFTLNTSSSPLDPSTPRSTKSVRPSSSNPQLSAVLGSDTETVSSHNQSSHTATTTSRKSGKSSPASFVVRVTVDRELLFASGPRKTVSEGATPRSGHGSTGGGKPGTHQMIIDAPGSVAKSESAVVVRTLSQTLSSLAVSGKLPRDEGTETNSEDRSADGASSSSQPALPTEQLTLAPQNRLYSASALGRVSRNVAKDELHGPNTSRSQDGTRQSYGTHPPNRDWDPQSPSATSGYASPQIGKQEGKRRVQISEKVFHSDGTVLPQKDMEEEEGPSEVQSSTNRAHFGAEKGVQDDENERQGYESDFEEQYASDFESEGTRTSHATRRVTPYPDALEMLEAELEDDEDQPVYPQSAFQHGSITPGRVTKRSRQRLQATLPASKSQPITPRQNLRPQNDWKNNSG
ncbi:hypothetical protein CBR_g22980 [Chara braunii]|uniref:Uncharacterized protein n=1 Tax=Chara braunii TaxID=69332 RepID=A0A388L380_CHABU|nr:hypothetical protein CBR_g22980 [Chara braunii]|eukprot:GBG76764.1 hypothetical protein CBR_g22980 [Chara braunii]